MKKWYRSKTVWVNLTVLMVGLLGTVAGSELLAENKDLALIITALVIPMLNVVIRWLTTVPITSVAARFDKYRASVMPK